MERYSKENKSAFIMAGLVILVCLVSLTGATFALFTSSPEDGTIGIVATSGNVKVDIVDSDTEASLIGKSLLFDAADNNDEGILFEPGATFYTKGFKAKNIGDIPINFRMYISEDENLDMDEFEKAFDFYITTDPTDPTNAEELISFTGRLEVGQSSDTYYLVIKMKETAGNDFQKTTYSGIGITVCAVQGNAKLEEIDKHE